jgi:hypothetical protein
MSNTDTSDIFDTLGDNEDDGSQHGSTSGLTEDLEQMGMDLDMDMDIEMDMDDDNSNSDEDGAGTPVPLVTLSFDDSDDDSEGEDISMGSQNVFNFTAEELETIRLCIHDIQLPTWV